MCFGKTSLVWISRSSESMLLMTLLLLVPLTILIALPPALDAADDIGAVGNEADFDDAEDDDEDETEPDVESHAEEL
jgi:hypothetical protein